MTRVSDREYTVAAFCEILHNGIELRIAWEAVALTQTGKQFDEAIQAAIQAQDWLTTFHN